MLAHSIAYGVWRRLRVPQVWWRGWKVVWELWVPSFYQKAARRQAWPGLYQ